MSAVFLIIGLLVGAIISFFVTKALMKPVKDLSLELNLSKEEQAMLRGKLETLKEENIKISSDLAENNRLVMALTAEKSTLDEKQKAAEEKLKDLHDVKDKLTKEFENLANRIFQEKMTNFQKDSAVNMNLVLEPFKNKLGDFQKTVTQYREDEMKESTTLKAEIDNIFKLNQKLSTDAQNLTKALKGDKKSQGNWGELILERVLESSGLREGEEYVLQGKEMGLSNDEGRSLKPDVIIKLPEGKHIIVDSKVTLNGYERFINCEEEGSKTLTLKEFLAAIKNHITLLSGKKYQNLDNVVSLDYVLMFIPIEGAFSTALQNDTDIFKFAWDRGVILVSPTTLMVTLRTVESIWKQEKQNKYALEISKQAGDLYDKFFLFMEDFTSIKDAIDNCHKSYDSAMNRLSTGRGNIVGRFNKLKDLGAKASKQLDVHHDEID